MSFKRSDVARIASLASKADEGSGSGATVYASTEGRRRYIVGGYGPTLLYPTMGNRAAMRVRIWDATFDPRHAGADTLGYWEDKGTVYVDFGTMHDGLGEALSLARERGELAIYDVRTGECITVADAMLDAALASAMGEWE